MQKSALLLVNMHNKFKTALIAITCILTIGLSLDAQELREWVDSSGKFKISGTFQKLEEDNVFLERADGATIKIPLSSLSTSDKQYVTDLNQPKDSDEEMGKTPNSETSDSSSSGDAAKAPIERSIVVDAPGDEFDFVDDDQPAFESAIDIELVKQLPPQEREITLILHKRPNPVEVGKAFASLAQLESIPSVTIRLLREMTLARNKYYRIQSLKLLAIFDPDKSFDRIIESLDDRSFSVRVSSLELIQELQDERAVEHLIARFAGRERNKISKVLASFGSKVEEPVINLLEHKNRTVVADAIRLLEKIGTEKSIDAITPLLESRAVIRLQAESSLKKIQKRLDE